MSQYTTEEVLEIMEEWYAKHETDAGFDDARPFARFNDLSGTDLTDIDLSGDRIENLAEEYRQKHRADPPWICSEGDAGLDLRGAFLSSPSRVTRLTNARLQCAHLDGAELRSAILDGARLQGTDLSRAQLQGARLGAQLQNANLSHAQLQKANFSYAKLQCANLSFAQLQEAWLSGANLECADLGGAQLQGANLSNARLQKANLSNARLQTADLNHARLQGAWLNDVDFTEARIEDVSWENDYVVGEERSKRYGLAARVYRRLKQSYNGSGQYDHAGEFHIRELLMQRKDLWNIGWPLYFPGALLIALLSVAFLPMQLVLRLIPGRTARDVGRWNALRDQREALVLFFSATLMGHGERPSWVLAWVVVCFAAFTLAYWLLTALPDSSVGDGSSLVDSIRYSADVMTSFGKREGVEQWAQDAGLVQSFISYVLLALFLVTFVRKVSPR